MRSLLLTVAAAAAAVLAAGCASSPETVTSANTVPAATAAPGATPADTPAAHSSTAPRRTPDTAAPTRVTSSGAARGYCPPPEAAPADPSPCITYDWGQRYAENHGYRQEQPISAQERTQAQPMADALATALRALAGRHPDTARIRAAAGQALGLPAARVELKSDGYDVPQHGFAVGGGQGKVCVNGTVSADGAVHTEVAGRTLDGPCLPGDGGH
ncbi:precorrin-3B C(17)-methyltransferase [Peterkaempfera sp. SMS 1(5)a]|uniref:precorrin-3B C(17)-methyltransferase n=1 Tax=Peterkaempfera podocarpi TaxID=3232308 RepID=UPI00366DC0B5